MSASRTVGPANDEWPGGRPKGPHEEPIWDSKGKSNSAADASPGDAGGIVGSQNDNLPCDIRKTGAVFGDRGLHESGTVGTNRNRVSDADINSDSDNDDDLDAASDKSGSAFESGKSFWLKLLLEHREDGQSSDEDEDVAVDENGQKATASLRGRKSLLGREIEATLSSGSPLSETSPLNSKHGIDASKSSSGDATNGQPISMESRRLAIVQQWEHRLSASRGLETGDVCQSEPKAALRYPEPATQQSSGLSSRRSFGDVTNQLEPPSSGKPPVTSSGTGNCRPTVQSSWRKIPISQVGKARHVIGKDEPISSTTTGSTRENSSSATSSTWSTAGLTAHTVVPKPFRGPKLEKVCPNLDDQRRFEWAYNTWTTAGLMKNRPIASKDEGQEESRRQAFSLAGAPRLPRRLAQAEHMSAGQPGGVKEFPSNDGDEGVAMDDTISDTTGASGEGRRRKWPSQEREFPAEGIDPVPSNDSDHTSGFRDLLNLWRDQSKSQLLSPSLENHDPQCSESSSFSELEEGCIASPRNTNIAGTFPRNQPSIPGFGEASNVKVEDSSKSGDKLDSMLQEVSIISVVSSEIVPSNTGSNQDISSGQLMKSEAFVDSDSFEEEYFSNLGGDSSRAIVILQDRNQYEVIVGESDEIVGNAMVVRNLGLVAGSHDSQIMDYAQCECSRSIFSGNDDLISFFLPQMGMACACGRLRRGLLNPDDPTAIENVLRPWQAEFLKSFGIHRGEQLVKARHRSADILARALRQWRKKHDMLPFKTSSCGMAINIWAKTCKAFVRSIRKQLLAGNGILERQPGALLGELSQFLGALPAAPKRREFHSLCSIEPESQVEV